MLMPWHVARHRRSCNDVARHRRSCNDVASERRALNGKKKGGTLGVYRFFVTSMFRFWEQPNLEETGGARTGGGGSDMAVEKLSFKARDGKGEASGLLEDAERKTHAIAAEGDLPAVERAVSEHPEFIEHMKRYIREQDILPEKYVLALEGVLEQKDWKLLDYIWLYDDDRKILFSHSLRTFRLALEKFERIFSAGGRTLESIAAPLGRESGKGEDEVMKEILRVAVVHDIGKLNITADVIENSVRDSESEAYLVRCCESEKKNERDFAREILSKAGRAHDRATASLEEPLSPEVSEETVRSTFSGKRVNMFMPAETLFRLEYRKQHPDMAGDTDAEQATRLQNEEDSWVQIRIGRLERVGFSGQMTLREILDAHEEKSQPILEKYGYSEFQVMLAAHHHHADPDIPNIAPSLIRFCDEFEAISSSTRSYKLANSLEKTLAIIAGDVRREPRAFNSQVAALCMIDEISREGLGHTGPVDIDKESEIEDDENLSLPEALEKWQVRVRESGGDVLLAREVVEFVRSEVKNILSDIKNDIALLRKMAEAS